MSLRGPIPGVPKYINDGKGRDTYISFYNGGFSKYPYSKSYKKDYYQISPKINHPDLYMRRPIIKYNMDGIGRDYFIHQNILSEHCKLKEFLDFPHMLRNGIEFNPLRINKSLGKTKFEKNLINRIFYGKCNGVKDRLMEPKVKFNKINKNIDNKINLTNPSFNYNLNENSNKINNVKLNSTFNKFKYNVTLTDNNNKNNYNNNVKTKKNKISLSIDKKRKFLNRNMTNDIMDINEKEFMNSVNTLYLFNHKKRKDKKLELPNLI